MNAPNRETIGQYEIVEQIGVGGMATVYKGYHERLDRHVAIKVMHQSFLADDSFRARFSREAKIVARLEHTNIVPVYDYDEVNGQPYLIMKHIDGRTLKDVMREKVLTLDEIRAFIPQIADSLTYAHSMGVLHRDVKPSNILIDERNQPYLTDFGLARITQQGESSMSADMMLGTPHYISPEQAQGLPDIDARADVYSLGIILYELVTGQVPFTGDTAFAIVHKHIYAAPPPASELNPEVPPAVEAVLTQALSKTPSERYDTPNAMMQAFEVAVDSSGLKALDDERASIAQSRIEDISERTPGGGKYVSVPAPVALPDAGDGSTQSRFEQFFKDISERFSTAADNIRNDFETNGTVQTLRNKLPDGVRVESDANGFRVQFGKGSSEIANAPSKKSKKQVTVKPIIVGKDSVRTADAIERDWSMDGDMVRRRVNQRMQLRAGLIAHAVIFIIAMIFIFGGRANVQATFLQEISSEAFIVENGAIATEVLTPLSALRYDVALLLMWGSGLIAHALGVFYKSGNRYHKRRRVLQETMTRRFGEDWANTVDERTYKRQRRMINRQFDKRLSFIRHFIGAILFALAIRVVWSPILEMLTVISQNEPQFPLIILELPVPLLALIAALISVLVHGIVLAIGSALGEDARERAIDREVARELEYSTINGVDVSRRGQPTETPVPEDVPDDSVFSKPKRTDSTPQVRLNSDGEFTESFVSEMDNDTSSQDYQSTQEN